MADPAGTKIVEEPQKNVQTDHPVVPDTRRHQEEAEKRVNPVWCHIIQKNVG